MADDTQNTRARDAYLRELERKSLDTIMVFNPTDKDYLLEWDKHYHRIPSKGKDMGFGPGKMELPRYLAEKYAREMKNIMVNIASEQFMDAFRKERRAKGQPFRDKFEENNDALPLVPKTSDAEKIRQLYNQIILGVVREYGMEQGPESEVAEPTTKTPEETIFENMNKRYETEPTAEPDVSEPTVTTTTTDEPIDVAAEVKQ